MPRTFLLILAVIALGLIHIGCGPSSEIPERFVANRDSMTTAFSAFDSANQLSQPPAGQSSFEMSDKDRKQMLEYLERGLQAESTVSNAFLDWLHPEMRRYYRQKYLRGQRLYYEGQTQDDVSKQVKGNQLIQQFYSEYWREHAEQITSKAFGDG